MKNRVPAARDSQSGGYGAARRDRPALRHSASQSACAVFAVIDALWLHAGYDARLSPELRPHYCEGARRIVVTLRAAVQHAGERSLRREAARFEEARHLALGIREIDEHRPFDLIHRALEQ